MRDEVNRVQSLCGTQESIRKSLSFQAYLLCYRRVKSRCLLLINLGKDEDIVQMKSTPHCIHMLHRRRSLISSVQKVYLFAIRVPQHFESLLANGATIVTSGSLLGC